MRGCSVCSVHERAQLDAKRNWNSALSDVFLRNNKEEPTMGRYLLLWLLGIPIPILVLIWIFGGLH